MVEQVQGADGEIPGIPRTQWPMDVQLKDIQPGGGVIIRLEQQWGANSQTVFEVVLSQLREQHGDTAERRFQSVSP